MVLSVCMGYPALLTPTPLQYGLSPKRCALHRLYFAIQHKMLISLSYLTSFIPQTQEVQLCARQKALSSWS